MESHFGYESQYGIPTFTLETCLKSHPVVLHAPRTPTRSPWVGVFPSRYRKPWHPPCWCGPLGGRGGPWRWIPGPRAAGKYRTLSRCIRIIASYTGVFLVDSHGIVALFLTIFMFTSHIFSIKNTKLIRMNIRFLKSLTEILHTEMNLLRNMKSFSEFYEVVKYGRGDQTQW